MSSSEIDAGGDGNSATEMVERLRGEFRTRKTIPLKWRLKQLARLRQCMVEHHTEWCQALYDDLHKNETESKISELSMIFSEIALFQSKLAKWAKADKVPKPSLLLNGMDSLRTTPNPYGVVLIISPWNYPVQLSIVAIIGAIGAGNCVVLKPSEHAPATAALMERVLPKFLDPSCFAVYNGGIPETTALLRERFDYIMYTGSTPVGKIIMKAAAEHLTPVTLELGGKSPVIVDASCDLRLTARRICFGKFMNAGQTCIAPDYALVDESIEEQLFQHLKTVIAEMYGEDPSTSPNYGRIINERHWERLTALLNKSEASYGGSSDGASKYIAPTLVRGVTPDHPLMEDELFGPVLPILTIKNVDEAIEYINDRPKPLACYLFSTNKRHVHAVEQFTSSGALVVNDTIIHSSMHTIPFGGVGGSGMGAYHGHHSFKTFSHEKPVVVKYDGLEGLNDVRMPPYNEKETARLLWALGYPSECTGPCLDTSLESGSG